jgi:acetyltransferase-like isoleucine patch superfamily enzyme
VSDKSIVFLGSNSNLLLYYETAKKAGLTVAGIVDNDYASNTNSLYGIPVLASERQFEDQDFLEEYKSKYLFFIATNWSPDPSHKRDCGKRRHLIDVVKRYSLPCVNIIDPSAQISNYAILGHGVYIGALSYVEPDVTIGDYVQIHYGVGVSHGSKIGTNTIVQGQAGITADVGADCYIGMWSKLFKLDLLKVGNGATINPGLYVSRDVDPGEHVRLSRENKRVFQYPALST